MNGLQVMHLWVQVDNQLGGSLVQDLQDRFRLLLWFHIQHQLQDILKDKLEDELEGIYG